MQAYLRAQGQLFVYGTAHPNEDHDTWDKHNKKALGNITLRVSSSIQVAISHLTTVKEVWDHLKENYSAPSIGSAYTKLSQLLSTTIPTGSHPAPAIMKMLSHFAYLKDTGCKFPANVQVMVILCKLPPTMEVVAQILSQTSPSKIKMLKPDSIVKVATLSFKQKGTSHGGSKAPQANKLSAVKCKQADPKFAQQQQQGRSNGGGSRNAPAQGQGNHHHCGGRKAFDLVHHLGVEPSCQTIHTLDLVISTASANLDQPKAGPSSLKHPCLKERIAMDVEEDTISLGDEEEQPFIYEDFTDRKFNDVNEMDLNHYNAVSMNLGVEASLFRQVPPTCTLLTHTDTLPLHVCYTPALYIIHDEQCVNCKGKMADSSEMSGTFWLLDSGASCHFTSNLRDFASYQELKHKHFTKTANGVAKIAGIGMVLLWCLDHNTGDEKVVKLTQVLHMPGTTACLISMGEMLL
ncbi:hypothetical protein SCLCIDRAFT_25201 [Scleroderma citrinum Foug A]|uniref:Retrovirus-related Pol polyprotein from transposon TNT 1-94-like beta-barrel domain-containing protein n=1 Tax=Scleroderma citrinum Foug A TaxID=1036808 RepID=A0A0C2ZL03_9AGAM|nr:hypothetical protein SCLCIDRAFT_25201 [Scleroderma citrinum Foug A]